MKSIKAILVVLTLAFTGGCAIVPVGPGYHPSAGYGAQGRGYYGPSVGVGIGFGGHGRRY